MKENEYIVKCNNCGKSIGEKRWVKHEGAFCKECSTKIITPFNKGVEAYNDEKYDDAIEYFRDALKTYREFWICWLNKGYAHQDKGDYQKAVESFQEAWKLGKDRFPHKTYKHHLPEIEKGYAQFHAGNYEEAIDCSKKILSIDENSGEAWYLKGQSHLEKREFNEALSCFDEISRDYWKGATCESLETFLKAKLNQGGALFKLNKYKEALDCFKTVTSQDPLWDEGWHNLGETYRKKEEYDEAIKCYIKAIEANPENHDSWYGKGISHYLKMKEIFYSTTEVNRKQIEKQLAEVQRCLQEAISFDDLNKRMEKTARIVLERAKHLISEEAKR